jgi:hypothetical protein
MPLTFCGVIPSRNLIHKIEVVGVYVRLKPKNGWINLRQTWHDYSSRLGRYFRNVLSLSPGDGGSSE